MVEKVVLRAMHEHEALVKARRLPHLQITAALDDTGKLVVAPDTAAAIAGLRRLHAKGFTLEQLAFIARRRYVLQATAAEIAVLLEFDLP
jgi:hypothetical protein